MDQQEPCLCLSGSCYTQLGTLRDNRNVLVHRPQPREQKRTSDDTTCTPTGIPQMKSTKWGRITVKYNYVRIQEYVDGNRGHTIVSS